MTEIIYPDGRREKVRYWIPIAVIAAAIASACEMATSKEKAARAQSAAIERAKAGPFISATKQLTDQEEIATVVIPSSIGPMLDQHCYIYRHAALKTVSFQCPADRPLDVSPEQ